MVKQRFYNEKHFSKSRDSFINLLKGNLAPVIQQFKYQMKEYVQHLAFEKAAQMKKKIEYLENYKARSVVVSNKLNDIDVFSIIKQDDIAYVNFLMVTNGTISQTKTIKVETHLDETAEEILSFTIAQLRSIFKSESSEIIVPFGRAVDVVCIHGFDCRGW